MSGRVASPNRLSSSTMPASGHGPSGFDPARVSQAIDRLTPKMPAALFALPREPGTWMTVSEMRPYGSTGAGSDCLYIMNLRDPLCERRWVKWGSERGQRRGEGYEYTITPFGAAVREALRDSDRSGEAVETAQTGSAEGESAGPQDIAQNTPPKYSEYGKVG